MAMYMEHDYCRDHQCCSTASPTAPTRSSATAATTRSYGLGGNDVIQGGGGADYINGGTGTDTASYSDSSVGVTVSLAIGEGFGGTAEGDTLDQHREPHRLGA